MDLQIGNDSLFYTTVGSGTPMVLMHGGLGFDHTYFRPWLDPLAEQMELVFYDHRGHGRSSPIADWQGVDHARLAADADALRAHLGHDQIFLWIVVGPQK